MRELVDFNTIRNSMTAQQLEQAIELTKKKMNTYKLLAVIFFLCMGVGVLLPFGKLAQLYSMGYAGLRGKRAIGSGGWAFLGFFMSLAMVGIAKVMPSMIAARYVDTTEN